MNAWDVGQLVLWLVVLFNLLLTVGLVRRLRTVSAAGPAGGRGPGGLPVGVVAPEFTAPDQAGASRTRSELGSGPLALGFFSPGCSACVTHAPDFVDFAERAGRSGVTAVAVMDTEPAEGAELADRLPGVPVLYAPPGANSLLMDYAVDAFPTYTVVDVDGRVAGSFGSQPELDRWLGGRRPASSHSHP